MIANDRLTPDQLRAIKQTAEREIARLAPDDEDARADWGRLLALVEAKLRRLTP